MENMSFDNLDLLHGVIEIRMILHNLVLSNHSMFIIALSCILLV
jgi:hypothetical protein